MRDNEFNLFTIENWRDIAGYEGLYEVSTCGRVRSLDMFVRNRNGCSLRKGRILRPRLVGSGYQQVNLHKNGKKKNHYIHRLVANEFLPNPKHFKEVNHINECKDDNRAENLEWCDRSHNINYGTRNQRVSKALRGKPNIACSKRVAQIDVNTNELIKIWPSTKECGRYGFVQQNISDCCRGKRKVHKGYRWSYIE